MQILSFLVAAGIAVGLASVTTPSTFAWAQANTQQPSAPQPFSDRELKQFAMAAVEVQKIRDAYMPKVEAATTDEQRQQVQTEALDEMTKAVTASGLTVDGYNEIFSAAQDDPALARRIQDHATDAQ